ncbi:AGAP008767-PA-like protein [Anopheles sinensis]|uniref:AGAP008767-PA-like protein n=1 Tax=Anopheles sinensis TaxID=74873 RepID=A0A084VMQ6_ANOSI|nr:AGAP008767-PA-like protein [Anopheles sinensis]
MNQSTMSEENHSNIMDKNIDFHIVQLFERLESLRKDPAPKLSLSVQGRANMHKELRTLELWRSVTSECLASFFYVFVVCGAAAGAGVGASVSSLLLATSLASGLIVVVLTQCFLHVSGAHINPAVTMALAVTRKISALRALLYITAQCGGSIAGAAMLYGVTVPGYQGNLQAAVSHSAQLAPWERFGVEFILTFIVVLAYLISTSSFKKYFGSSAIAIGAAYSACSFVSMPYLNPARSLGPSFVLNKWDNHWVYWIGPFVGSIIAGLIHQFVFTPKPKSKGTPKSNNVSGAPPTGVAITEEGCSSYTVDVSKLATTGQGTVQGKFQNLRHHSGTLPSRFCHSMYATTDQPTIKIEPLEPIYGAAKSMFGKSPQMSRSNLNRSQSVYAKSNTALNHPEIPVTVAATATLRPGALVPAQSLYPLRVSQQQHQHQHQHQQQQNQNVQNQLQQRSESIYGLRTTVRQQQQLAEHLSQQLAPRPNLPDGQGFQPIYAIRNNNPSCSNDALRDVHEQAGCDKVLNTHARADRPESMYAATRRIHSTHSDDSSYGSYHGTGQANTPPTREHAGAYGGSLLHPAPNAGRTHTQHSHGGHRGVTILHDPNMPPPPPPLMSCS